MATLLILLLFLDLSAGLRAGAAATGCEDCKPKTCNSDGPEIRHPFRLKDDEQQQQQPEHCGCPGFDLSCDHENHTMLELPFSVKVAVKEIDYISQLIHTYDPHGCFPRLLQNLSLYTPASPFQLATNYKYNFSFFSCSSTEPISYNPITCLSSDPNQKVYAFLSDSSMYYYPLLSCKKMSFKISSPIPSGIFDKQPYELILKWSTPTCGSCDTPQSRTTGILRHKFLVAAVIFAMYCVLIAICCVLRLIIKKREDQAKIERFLEDYKALKPARYSFADIRNITNKFKDKIGQGGYGTVYKGKLSNDVHVAVKILDNVKGNGDEFINEVGTIGTIHHINVVRLVGYCADGFKRALVYEFLSNHSLEKFILSKRKKNSLGWEKLHDIALGIAKGIDYLHQGCNQRILHFDIKPHNILLDHNFNPKISDFGLAKLCSKEQSVVSMTAARGTVGYIAPEVFSRNFGKVSCKSDVYSFGMLLLEMVGVRNNNVTQNKSEVYFPEWIYNRLDHGEDLEIQIDEDGDAQIAKKLTIVGLWCIHWYPMDRPSMKVVVQMLEGDGGSLTMPSNPFASANPMTTRGKMRGRLLDSELEEISEFESFSH
ncbi:hypothetical protein CsSME_00001964 [Camellia sinensis var. sinensis]